MRAGTFIFVMMAAAPLFAYENFSAAYDPDHQVTLEGPVTQIEWVNPHAFLILETRDAAGTVANWAVEIGNPLELERSGWRWDSVHIGDVVRVDGIPSRDPVSQAFAKSVVLARTGKRLFVIANKAAASAPAAPAPRWPNGHVRLGPAPGQKGYWGTTRASLVENNAAIPMNEDGLLHNLADAARVAPFQPWAQALYEYRQRTLLRDDPDTRCLPPGGPRQFQTANGFQLVEQPELGRILVLLGGGDRNWRVIYTDGRAQGQPDEVVRGFYGNSVGHWEGDALVVDSIGFNESFWFAKGGLPHTEGLHLVERFTRPDLHTLKYQVTVDDPRTYTRKWSANWTLPWVANQEIEESFCEENAESTFLR